jgi:carnitine-CoA ligase
MGGTGEVTIGEILGDLGLAGGATTADLVRRLTTYEPSTAALVHDGTTTTYGGLLALTAGVARQLTDAGVGVGDRVAYIFRAEPAAVATMLAVGSIGAIAVPIYAEMTGQQLLALIVRATPKVLVVGAGLESAVAEIRPQLDSVSELRSADFRPDEGSVEWLAGLSPLAATDPFAIFSTSGTTGLPKGVVMPQMTVLYGHIQARKIGIDASRVYYCASWGHGGSVTDITMALWVGGAVVMAPRFSASNFWREVAESGTTFTRLAGTMPRVLFNQTPGAFDTSHGVRITMSAGMPEDIWRAFEERFNTRVVEIYGQTDAGGCFLLNAGDSPVGSVGKPYAEMEARIVDDDGGDVATGDVGELLMRPRHAPPVVMYFNDPAAVSERVRDGWIWMGDYFRDDEDGNFYFIDRKRDMIRRRGINIAPVSIEVALMQHPSIDLAVAFAVPSAMGEDEIKVVVVPAGDEVTASVVADFAERELPRHMRPRYIEIATHVPTTSGTERVQRSALRQAWSNPQTWDIQGQSFLSLENRVR